MISVVMAAYNAERHIGAAIESIQQQTVQDFEFIIVDDGSTDSTLQILHRYAEQDPRIKVIAAEHGGVSAAANAGLEAASREWVARMDADDIALPHRFQCQLEAATRYPEVVVWGSYVTHINERGQRLSLTAVGPTTITEFRQIRAEGRVAQVMNPTALIRREVLTTVGGYDTRMVAGEDYELFDRIGVHGPIISLEEPLVLYRVHKQSTSSQRYFEQRKAARYVEQRARARLNGKQFKDFGTYLQDYDRMLPPMRLMYYLDDLSRYHYRHAGVAYGERDKINLIKHLSISALLNPGYALPRLWRQVFSSRARQARDESKVIAQA